MTAEEKLHDPWLVAAWPGMGGVAITAGYYLMAKLGMHLLVEFPAAEFFDIDHVEVKDGLILTRRLPRSRLFLWSDPKLERDLIVFIGEAQPPARGGAFCRQVIEQAKVLGVRRVFTFAAMATAMRPMHDSRVFGAAIDRGTLVEFKQLDVDILEGGTISGLNGVLLGMAAAGGLPGGCLLGEIPHVFSQIPFPKAALAVLEFFGAMTGIDLDYDELREHSAAVEKTLEDFLVRMEHAVEEAQAEPGHLPAPGEAGERASKPAAADQKRIEELFAAARADRSRAYELKQELDRLGMFHDFEDRFLDLFKDPG
jgi:proteasome assembly chaperone (PAC2) family protein